MKNPIRNKILKSGTRFSDLFLYEVLWKFKAFFKNETSSLGVNEINEIFDQVGTSGNGRITSAQFLAQYNMQNRSNEERDFVNEAFVPLVNLFEALDPSNTGYSRNLFLGFQFVKY